MANPPNLARTGPHAGEEQCAGVGERERDGGLWFEDESNAPILSAAAGIRTETATLFTGRRRFVKGKGVFKAEEWTFSAALQNRAWWM